MTREQLQGLWEGISTPNISDAMDRAPGLPGMYPLRFGWRASGPALTVHVPAGDWTQCIAALESASAGDVLVIDAAGEEPASWGELATRSAINKKLAGVVVHGAVRDAEAIRELSLPVFAKVVCPHTRNPTGYGAVSVELQLGGATVRPGDWIVADDNGVICIPHERLEEIAHKARAVVEKERELRERIQAGSTLWRELHAYERRPAG